MEPNTTIASLDITQPPVQETASIGTNIPGDVYPSIATATDKTNKIQFGLADVINKPMPDVFSTLLNGGERDLRNEAASKLDVIKRNARQALISKLAFEGKPMTPEIMQAVLDPDAPHNRLTNPDTVIEEGYAKKFMGSLNLAAISMNDSFMRDAVTQIPNQVSEYNLIGGELLTKRAILYNKIQDAQDLYEKQSTFGAIVDTAKSIIPGYMDYTNRSGIAGVFLGENVDRQRSELLHTPIAQFKSKLDAMVDNMNPGARLEFLQKMLGQSSEEKYVTNFLPFVDYQLFGAAALGITKSLVLRNQVKQAVRDVVKAAETIEAPLNNSVPAAAALGVGDIKGVGVHLTTDSVIKNFKGTSNPVKEGINSLTTNLKIDRANVVNDTSAFGQQYKNMLTEMIDRTGANLQQTVQTVARVQRIPIEKATEQELRALAEAVPDFYRGISNDIIDVTGPHYNKISNSWYHSVAIGHKGGELFQNINQLKGYAKLNKIPEYELGQRPQGLGHYIVLTKNMDDTDPIIRNLLERTAKAETPVAGPVRNMLSWLRSPEDTVTAHQRKQRKVATYAQARMQGLMDSLRTPIEDLKKGIVRNDPVTGEPINAITRTMRSWGRRFTPSNRDRWRRLEETLDANKSMPDPERPGEKGYSFKTAGELNDHYLRTYHEMPSTEEVKAYFADRMLNEADLQLRNISLYRNKARLGAETHNVYMIDDDKQKVTSNAFDGVQHKRLKIGDDAILVVDKSGRHRLYGPGELSKYAKTQKQLAKEIESGERKLVELYDPELRPLQGFGDVGHERVRYVISSNIETKSLTWNQLPRRGGGHFDYDYEHYIKQPKVSFEKVNNIITHWYEGDQTLMPISNRALGKDIIKDLNVIRQLIKEDKLKEARDYVTKSKLPMSWDDIHGWFRPIKGPDGVTRPARFNKDTPFYVVPKNKNINDLDKSLSDIFKYTRNDGSEATSFKDGTRQGSLARQFQVEYAGHRDAFDMFTIHNEGSRHNPVYKHEPAEFVSAIPTTNRALSKIINSFFMDDMKISGVESWIRVAAKYLKAEDSELAFSPFFHFNDVDRNSFKAGVSEDVKQALLADNYKLRQFTGIPDKIDTFLHNIAQTLEDFNYNKYGGQVPGHALVPAWLLSHTKDPVAFLRAATYHAKLGLFAVPQMIVQNMSYATIFAISPRYAVTGTYGAFLHGLGRLNKNPEIINALDNLATKMRIPGLPSWKKGQFKEAFEFMESSGFGHVGGEYVNLDDMSKYNVVKSGWRTFLDWGQTPFRMGERNVRRGAYYTAFKEFRDKFPTGRITQANEADILDRADMLYTNMSRASASTLHTGPFSLTTQFLSYQIRLAELMAGKRLAPTLGERNLIRARAFGIYGSLFGLPTAFGISGLPLQDYIREEALKAGYIVGDNWITTLLDQGIPSFMGAMITGEGPITDINKRTRTGTWYNFANRFGAQGFESLNDALRSDKTWYQLIGGPSWSVLANTWEATDGFTKSVRAGMSGKNLFKPQDFIDPFKEISSVNQAWKATMAINYGRWLSKNEAYVQKVGSADAVFRAVTGLQDAQQDDVFFRRQAKNSEIDLQKTAVKHFTREWHRYIQAVANQDFTQAKDFHTRAFAILELSGYPKEDYNKVLAQAAKGYETLINSTNSDFFMKSIPETPGLIGRVITGEPSLKKTRMDAMQRWQKLKQERGQ